VLLRFMHAAALEAGLGERLALIPALADPKNLFGTLLPQAQPQREHPASVTCQDLTDTCALASQPSFSVRPERMS
jgi:hypothetical protein